MESGTESEYFKEMQLYLVFSKFIQTNSIGLRVFMSTSDLSTIVSLDGGRMYLLVFTLVLFATDALAQSTNCVFTVSDVHGGVSSNVVFQWSQGQGKYA